MSLLKSSQNLEKNMDKKQLINKCRYYKGEPDCPESIVKQGKEICWYYEMKWVEMVGTKDYILSVYLDEYSFYGYDAFEENDSTPMTLKALLLNRFYHQDGAFQIASTPDNDFKKWYLDVYMVN